VLKKYLKFFDGFDMILKLLKNTLRSLILFPAFLSIVNYQLSTINCQLSTVNYQL